MPEITRAIFQNSERQNFLREGKGASVPTFPVLANTGAMSQFVGAFEVTSKLTGKVYQCRFSHMWNGIATRHSDTIDTKFFVEGESFVVRPDPNGFLKFSAKTFS